MPNMDDGQLCIGNIDNIDNIDRSLSKFCQGLVGSTALVDGRRLPSDKARVMCQFERTIAPSVFAGTSFVS